jgi:pimeloyl-ACP methyl ester carboxylesterase
MNDILPTPEISSFTTVDGTRIAWREIGTGRALLLIHGFISDSVTNWMKHAPTARTLADAGYRVIMPDLRAHGASDKPHDPARYTPDILADDQFALIDHLSLSDYDLGGYSLGGRTVARMLARGATPTRAIISGMGLEGLTNTSARGAHFRAILTRIGQHEHGSAEWMAEQFLKSSGGDPVALNLILDTFVDTSVDTIASFDLRVGVICGAEDQDNGSAAALADMLQQGELITIPGNHMSAVTKPEFGAAFRDFLTA